MLGSLEFCTAALNTKMRLKVIAFSLLLSSNTAVLSRKKRPKSQHFRLFFRWKSVKTVRFQL